jgi:hypothetical protein
MALTLQSVIDLARIDLNDTESDGYRNSDADMLKHANAALLMIYNRAPHLWHGNYAAVPSGELGAGFTWPIHQMYLRPCADLVVALAETKDDEHTLQGRVQALLERAAALTVA